MREFNFDDSVMSTPDWLWEQPSREAMYDSLVSEFEIEDRIDAINSQLDYAQATMQSLKDDAHHQHSTFLEYTIVLLIAFEVLFEMHAIGYAIISHPGGQIQPPQLSNSSFACCSWINLLPDRQVSTGSTREDVRTLE